MQQTSTFTAPWRWRLPPLPAGPGQRVRTLYALFALSIVAFVAEPFVTPWAPALGVLMSVVGLVPCGLAWLFARALFQKAPARTGLPEIVVGALFATCLILYIEPSDRASGIVGYLREIQALLGSAVLLLTFLEALDQRGAAGRERRFRIAFAVGYAVILAVSFVFMLPEFEPVRTSSQSVLAMLALAGATAAFAFRLRYPPGAASVAASPRLAAAIVGAFTNDKLHLDSELKLAGLAAHVGEPEYKVSRAIVQELGYRNFNQLVNSYRVQEAQRRLASRAHAAETILTIAMQCGFGSVGVFNRQFKAVVGVTPSAFRATKHH